MYKLFIWPIILLFSEHGRHILTCRHLYSAYILIHIYSFIFSLCLCVSVSVSLFISLFLSLCLCFCLSLSVSLYLSLSSLVISLLLMNVLAGPWPRMFCSFSWLPQLPTSSVTDIRLGFSSSTVHMVCLSGWSKGLSTPSPVGRAHTETPRTYCCIPRLTAHRDITLAGCPLHMMKRYGASIGPRLQQGLWNLRPMGAIPENKEQESLWNCCKEQFQRPCHWPRH